MYSDVFCRVYNAFGWNYYPEAFGEQLLTWLCRRDFRPGSALDLACGTGILCRILHDAGIRTRGMDLSAGMIAIAREETEGIQYDVADMTTYQPGETFDLVTCTGDSLNHIMKLKDLEQVFRNVYSYLNPGGYFVFDLLNPNEVSTSEPFEMDFDDHVRVRFQMTCPAEDRVDLTIRVYEDDALQLEQIIRETIRDSELVCRMLRSQGFVSVTCADRLLADSNPGTTWFVVAQKPE